MSAMRGGFQHLELEARRQRLGVARQQLGQAQREVGLLQVARRDVDADRDVEPGAPPARQLLQRLASTQSPTRDDRPVFSISGRNCTGAIRPCCGWSQRSSASRPSTRPRRMSTLGW